MTFCSPTKASRRVVGICCLAALTGFAAMTLGCRQPEENANRVRVSGASTVYPIIVLAGEALKASGSRLEIQAQAGGSTRGFEDTLAGRNDLGAMAREPTAEEAAQIRQFPIAYDGVGVVVHGSNRVEHITTEDLRRIYRKEITDWAALGGEEESIVVVTKAEGHATLETFLEHTGLDRGALQVDVVGGDNAQVIRVVANTPGAIGYVSLGEVLHSIEIDIPLRLLELDGVAPTLEHVASRHYPMFRTLYLVSREEPQGASRALLDYLRTAEGRRIIEQGRYVPVDD